MISLSMVGEYRETDVRVNIWYLLLQFFVSGIHKIQKFFFSFFLFLSLSLLDVMSDHQEEE